MEIKLRRKGEIVSVDGFPEHSIPETIRPTDGLEGIDLTAYSVIYAGFGRHGHDKAKELHGRAPGAIVVYKYEWRNGWGEGVLLPDRFNPSRVRFYKSAAQVKAEAEEAKKKAAESLRDEVTKAIPGVRVYVGYNHEGVEVKPEQEAFSDSWGVYAKSLEEAQTGVEKMRPIWEEWNERALEAFLRHSGRENPGYGNIQIYPTPTHAKKVGVCYNHNDRKWVIFEKQEDGNWVETGTSSYGPPNSY